MKRSNDQNFQTERENTDKSLGEEREKTNLSIAQAKDKAESQTDIKVQQERAETDKATLDARTNEDSKRKLDRTTDDQTKAERKRADVAMEKERAHVDVAIVREREVKSTIETTILSQERELTDKSLAVERTTTDIVVTSSMVKLTKEVAEHSKTKVSLTTRDEFLAIVSHDLRNPIGAILSCMEMLLEKTADRKIDSETKVWIEMAKRNADSALRLINDILDMERIAEGKLELSKARVDLGRVLRESTESFLHAAISKNVILRSIPTLTLCELFCDHDRILQILANLIGNALKFTPEGGKVVLRAEQNEKDIIFSVCDTGPGIPEAKKVQIFEKYAQLRTADRRGLGLGLHISKMLVEAHGGNLWVETTLGHGSTFFFSIPLEVSAT